MKYPTKEKVLFGQIQNGALILLLLREYKTWEQLCSRFEYSEPHNLGNTVTASLYKKLIAMREMSLIDFKEGVTEYGQIPVGEIKDTGHWSKIATALGGISLNEAALISLVSSGMAVSPVFGRPERLKKPIDVFMLMPFKPKLAGIYMDEIKKIVEGAGLTIFRADEVPGMGPFMEKVWNCICAAELIIADCTERNPNVFYEIGIAHTVGKSVVLITQSEKDIPADIRQYEYIIYDCTPEGFRQLNQKLPALLNAQFGV